MNPIPEAELIEQIRAGSAEALGSFLEFRKHQLLGFLRHITGDHLLAVVELEDLFQELSKSAITALERIPKADLDVDKWLERLARRRVVDAHREHFGAAKRKRSRNQLFSQIHNSDDSDIPAFEQLLIASMTSPSMAVSRNWRLVRLQQALAGLDEAQQTLLRLRFQEGLPTAQIAEQTGKSDAAVRVSLSRLMARLQEILVDPK